LPPSDESQSGYAIAQDITPDAAGIDALHALLADLWQRFPNNERPSPAWQAAFITAVAEIASNIIRHSIPAEDDRARIHIATTRDSNIMRLVMTNPGRAFEEPSSDPTHQIDDPDPFDLPEGSYGLALARACLDTLQYERTITGDNTWTLSKRL
jgi:anti-sigma regulatory factor (Ser/Thr protein kinase)